MLNKAQVIGNLGQDPKVTQLSNGNGQMASFRVATTERGYTTQRGVQVPERTEWHNIVLFGKLADVAAKYLHKGSKVYVDGKMRTRKYTDRNGVERYITEINADNLEMLDPKSSHNRGRMVTDRRRQHRSSLPQISKTKICRPDYEA